jgi:hypothetical protein
MKTIRVFTDALRVYCLNWHRKYTQREVIGDFHFYFALYFQGSRFITGVLAVYVVGVLAFTIAIAVQIGTTPAS